MPISDRLQPDRMRIPPDTAVAVSMQEASPQGESAKGTAPPSAAPPSRPFRGSPIRPGHAPFPPPRKRRMMPPCTRLPRPRRAATGRHGASGAASKRPRPFPKAWPPRPKGPVRAAPSTATG